MHFCDVNKWLQVNLILQNSHPSCVTVQNNLEISSLTFCYEVFVMSLSSRRQSSYHIKLPLTLTPHYMHKKFFPNPIVKVRHYRDVISAPWRLTGNWIVYSTVYQAKPAKKMFKLFVSGSFREPICDGSFLHKWRPMRKVSPRHSVVMVFLVRLSVTSSTWFKSLLPNDFIRRHGKHWLIH